MSIVVIAHLRPIDGRLNEVLASMREAAPAIQAEDGCELYAPHVDGTGAIVLIEKWASVEALDAHGAGEPVAAQRAGLAGLLQGPAEVARLSPVGEGFRGRI